MNVLSLRRLAPLPLALSLLLAGCVTPPRTDAPLNPVDARALGLNGEALRPVDAEWWKRFGDPQLDALVAEALARNPSLDEALARVRLAQAQAISTHAGSLPSLSLNAQETRERESEHSFYPPRSLGIGPGGGGTYWVGQVSANLDWDLDFWGRHAALLRASKHQVEAARLGVAAARLALSGAIAQAYVDLYRAYLLADIASASERQREALLQLARDRQRAGLDSGVEVKTAEAGLPQARLARLQAENLRDLAVHRLAALSGHGAESHAGLTRPQLNLDAALPLPKTLPMDLLAHRPDVLAARARVDAASDHQDAARAAFYPDVSLHAFAGYQSVGLDKLFDSGSRIWGVGPAVHLPLFDAHRLKAGYLGAHAELASAVASYNETVLSAVRDVADQISRVDSMTRQRAEAEQAVETARATQALADSRYRAGLASRLPVLNAQTQLLNAQRDLVGIDAGLVVARVTLLLTLGGSFNTDTPSAALPASLSVTPAAAPGASS